jgi:hypothetical protein
MEHRDIKVHRDPVECRESRVSLGLKVTKALMAHKGTKENKASKV